MVEAASLGWMLERPVVIKVADQEGEFTVETYNVTQYGVMVDVIVGDQTIRRFVPWAQLIYMQQNVTYQGPPLQEPTQSPTAPPTSGGEG